MNSQKILTRSARQWISLILIVLLIFACNLPREPEKGISLEGEITEETVPLLEDLLTRAAAEKPPNSDDTLENEEAESSSPQSTLPNLFPTYEALLSATSEINSGENLLPSPDEDLPFLLATPLPEHFMTLPAPDIPPPVPTILPPPEPPDEQLVPLVDFSVSFMNVQRECGEDTVFNFLIFNHGTVPLGSWKIQIVDLTMPYQTVYSTLSNVFFVGGMQSCGWMVLQELDAPFGTILKVLLVQPYQPPQSRRPIKAVFTLCKPGVMGGG